MNEIRTIIISVSLSAVVSFGIAVWKLNSRRKQEREDAIEDWYTQALTLIKLISWELNRVSGEIEIDSRTGPTSFSDLHFDDSEESMPLDFLDELVYELFRHAGNAPYEIQPAPGPSNEENPVDDIRDFVSSYLEPEPDPTNTSPTVDDFRESWLDELSNIRGKITTQLDQTDPTALKIRYIISNYLNF